MKPSPVSVLLLAVIGGSLAAMASARMLPASEAVARGTAPATPAQVHPGPAASVTNGASARLPPEDRDPFWPVGYTPPPPSPSTSRTNETGSEAGTPDPEPPDRVVEWPTLSVKGITRSGSGRYMAMLDGFGLVEGGETVSVVRNGFRFRWVILSVTNQGVLQTKLDVVRIKE